MITLIHNFYSTSNIYCSRTVIYDDFLKNPHAKLDRREMGRVLIQTSAIIANCRDSFEMNLALSGSTGINRSSIVILRGSAGIHRGSASIHRGSTGYAIPQIIPGLCRQSDGASQV
jgi:hypothetical protein